MKSFLGLSVLLLLSVSVMADAAADKITSSNATSSRQAKYAKGDIPLLLIRPLETSNKRNYRVSSSAGPVAESKVSSGTDYYIKTSGGGESSFSLSNLLPHFMFDSNIFGRGGSHHKDTTFSFQKTKYYPKNEQKFTFTTGKPLIKLPVFTGYTGGTIGALKQKSQIKSPLHTSFIGDTSALLNPKKYFPYNYNPKGNNNRINSFGNQAAAFSKHEFNNFPPKTTEDLIIGKLIPGITNIRPSLPDLSNYEEYGKQSEQSFGNFEQINYNSYSQPKSEYFSGPQVNEFSYENTKSEKFVQPSKVITNYYVPKTINTEPEYKNQYLGSISSQTSVYNQGPQIEYFIPQEQESATIDIHTENDHNQESVYNEPVQLSSDIDQYFLPKREPDYHKDFISSLSSSKVVEKPIASLNHKPLYSSHFNIGALSANKNNNKENKFPLPETKFSSSIDTNSDIKFKIKPFKPSFTSSSEENDNAAPSHYFDFNDQTAHQNIKNPVIVTHPQSIKNHKTDNAEKQKNEFQFDFSTKLEAADFVKNALKNNRKNLEDQQSIYQYSNPKPQPPRQQTHQFSEMHHQQGDLIRQENFPFTEPPSQDSTESDGQKSSENYRPQHVPYQYRPVVHEKVNEFIENDREKVSDVRPVVEDYNEESHSKYDLDEDENAEPFHYFHEEMPKEEPIIYITTTLPIEEITTSTTSTTPATTTTRQSGKHNGISRPPLRFKATLKSPTTKDSKQLTTNNHKSSKTATTTTEEPQDNNSGVDTKSSTNVKRISCERQCIRNSSSQEYDPVCGSDGKTYSNRGKWKCVKQCGKSDLQVVHVGSCGHMTF